jgi:PRC-barrel domain
MDQYVSWIATAATIFAACLTASNAGSRITGYGFIVFTIGSIAWFTLGLLTGQQSLIFTNAVMTFLNLFGVWRWLGRQAKVEDGAKAAAQKSVELPGDTLFPASTLSSATLSGRDGSPLGACVDAMMTCRGGQVRYLVVSEGGVAGLGERLRRVEWGDAKVEPGEVRTDFDSASLAGLPELPKDNWPGR